MNSNHGTEGGLGALSAEEIVRRTTSGELSAIEVTEAALERIERLDGELHSFLTVSADAARHQARRADVARRRGDVLGPLHGVPVSLKDEVWTAGIRSTAGSLLYADFVPTVDAEAVARLRRAGAVIIGKTQLPEFASWPRSVNLVGPEARNPHDRSRISGASSGGSAVSVAAGMVPISLGSDGGGSIRIPSALCGVFGLFPTPGLVSDRSTFSYSPFASLGPISRSVRDAALMLGVIAGNDPRDPRSLAGPLPDYLAEIERGVDGLRVAFTADFGWITVDPRIAALASRAARSLEQSGAIVDEPAIAIEDIWPAFRAVTQASSVYGDENPPYLSGAEHQARLARGADQLMPPLAATATMPPATRDEYEEAMKVVTRVRDQMHDLLSRYDVICSPTMATVAPPIPDGWEMPYADMHMGTNFTSMANVCRQAAASHPCGTVDGLPVGLQVIGPARSEALVLRVCRALELAGVSNLT